MGIHALAALPRYAMKIEAHRSSALLKPLPCAVQPRPALLVRQARQAVYCQAVLHAADLLRLLGVGELVLGLRWLTCSNVPKEPASSHATAGCARRRPRLAPALPNRCACK